MRAAVAIVCIGFVSIVAANAGCVPRMPLRGGKILAERGATGRVDVLARAGRSSCGFQG
ncbi:hypothetical protein [Dokdonella sp.]|uniref:hypothetical protein n=1 Tax=Dokdonella sp. TaxID=2291710 RepID=UPI00378459E4